MTHVEIGILGIIGMLQHYTKRTQAVRIPVSAAGPGPYKHAFLAGRNSARREQTRSTLVCFGILICLSAIAARSGKGTRSVFVFFQLTSGCCGRQTSQLAHWFMSQLVRILAGHFVLRVCPCVYISCAFEERGHRTTVCTAPQEARPEHSWHVTGNYAIYQDRES